MVPALNEERTIAACLASLAGSAADHEVLVVDGGSEDRTCERAAEAGARVVRCQPGRARQQNAGAREARGEVLLFLHADLALPAGGLDLALEALEREGALGGGFFKRYRPSSSLLAAVAWLQNRVRGQLLGAMVGTNAMFVRRDVFEAMGGFPEEPFLEDVLFSDALNERGRIAWVRQPVTVSARKYLKDGAATRTLRNLWIMFQFRVLGRTPGELLEQYRGKKAG